MTDTRLEVWTRDRLHGFSIDKARLYGMPHIGCCYVGASVNSYDRAYGARCAVCGNLAHHSHHEPQKGMGGGGKGFRLGGFTLRPALIALCADCHEKRHKSLISFDWKWDDPGTEELWASGYLLESGFAPHDEMLFMLGCWEVFSNRQLLKTIRG